MCTTTAKCLQDDWENSISERVCGGGGVLTAQSAIDLATALAVDGVLTPACLTAAAESGVDPVALRRVWLYLVRFARAP